MKRGDVITVAAGSGFGGKPRPALVIQADQVELPTLIVLLFTSMINQVAPVRPHFLPNDTNGLREPSDLMTDLPTAVRREKVGAVIGTFSPDDMVRAEQALLMVLGFGL